MRKATKAQLGRAYVRQAANDRAGVTGTKQAQEAETIARLE